MSAPLTTPVPNPAIPQEPQPRAWDAGSTGNTFLDLLQRLKEHADAADASIASAQAHPSLANDVGAFKDVVLGTLLGLPLEGLDTASKMATGAVLSTLGNLTPHIDSNVPVLGGISDMAHQASDAPMRADPFQDLLARNQAGAAGHGFQVGLLNALLNPGNLLGGEGTGAHAFEAVATKLPTIEERAAQMAAAAGKNKQAADFLEAAAKEIAGGQPLSDVLQAASQATGKPIADLNPAEKLLAIPADSPFHQQLTDLLAPPPQMDLPPTITRASDYNKAARASGFPQLTSVPNEDSPLVMKNFSPFLAAKQLAEQNAFKNSGQQLLSLVGDGAAGDAATLADHMAPAPQAADLLAQGQMQLSPETRALIDKVAPASAASAASDLDRMDALSGPPLRSLLNDLLTVNYGSAAKRIVNNIAGAGVTFGPDARLLQNGQDVTRSVLDYLLRRSTLDDAGRNALQAQLFPESKVGQAAAQDAASAAPGLSQAEAAATMDQPDNLDRVRALILGERDRVGTNYPPLSADFYTKRVPGLDAGEVPTLLKQLQQEGTLGLDARNGYMVRPEATPPPSLAPGLTEATSVTDGAGNPIGQLRPQATDPRLAWQQNYVNQSQAGTDILAQGGKVAGSDVTQGAMNAMAPSDRMAMLQKLAGGDTTAAPVGATPAVPAAQTPALATTEQLAAAAPEVAPQAVKPEQIVQHIADGTVPPPEEVASIVADPTPPADLLKQEQGRQAKEDLFSDAADVPPKGGGPRNVMGIVPQVTQLGTTLSGGASGGIAGYQIGNGDGQDRQAGIGGAIAGAAIGAALGNRAMTPGGEATIRFFGAVGKSMVEAQVNALQNGAKNISPQALAGMWTAQSIQTAKNVFEEVLGNLAFMSKTDVGTAPVRRNVADLANAFTQGTGVHDLQTTVAQQMHAAVGLPDYVPNLGAGMTPALGYAPKTPVHPVISGLAEATMAATTPTSMVTSVLTTGTPIGGLIYGGIKGVLRPALTAAYEAFDTIVKMAFRSAVYEDAGAKQLAADAAPFLQKVQQLTGGVPAALPQSGMFSADTIRTALAGAPAGVADALANEWALTAQQSLDTAAAFSRQIFADFSNVRGFEKFVRSVVPFSSWVIRAIPRTLELVKDHPAVAAAYATQMIADGQRATQEGRPSSQVGGIPIDSNTPLIGKLADMETGGRGGVAHINPLNGILPIPTGVFGGMGLDTSGQDAPVYDPSGKMIDQNSNQKQAQLFYMQFADAVEHAGFSVNPIIQMLAYAANWDFKRPGSLSKDAGIEQALPGPRVGNPYALLDFLRQNVGGGTVNNTTAGDKILGQLFYDKYGMSMADPRAAKLVAQTMQPGNELVQQAESIANKAAVARNEIGDTLPSSVLGQTQHELDIQRAQGEQSRTNQALIAQAQADPQGFQDFMAQLQQRQMLLANLQKNYPVQYQQLMAQGQTPIKGANPVYGQLIAPQNTSPLLITQGTDTQHRAQQASLAWQQEHQALAYLAPSVYQAQLGALHQALGLPTQP